MYISYGLALPFVALIAVLLWKFTGWGIGKDHTLDRRFDFAGRSLCYFSTTVIVGVVLVLLMKTRLFPEMRIAVVPVPKVPVPSAATE